MVTFSKKELDRSLLILERDTNLIRDLVSANKRYIFRYTKAELLEKLAEFGIEEKDIPRSDGRPGRPLLKDLNDKLFRLEAGIPKLTEPVEEISSTFSEEDYGETRNENIQRLLTAKIIDKINR